MTDNLCDRIAAALSESLKSQAKKGGYANEYERYDDDGEPCGYTLLNVDAVLDPRIMADAVIAELGLEVTVAARSSDGSFRSFSIEGYWEERVSPND